MNRELCLEPNPRVSGEFCLRRKGHDAPHAPHVDSDEDRISIEPVFCAGIIGPRPTYEFTPCPATRQPLKMDGHPRDLVGSMVGYRCRECRYVFCASCAAIHFGRLPQEVAELRQMLSVAMVRLERAGLPTGDL